MQTRDAGPGAPAAIADARDALIEGIIAESEDETLMDRYLGGEDIDIRHADRRSGESRRARRFLSGAGRRPRRNGLGTCELLEMLTHAFPSPHEHVLPAVTRPDGSPVSTLAADPTGRSPLRWSRPPPTRTSAGFRWCASSPARCGPTLPVHVSGHGMAERGHPDHDVDEKVGALSSPLGKMQRPIDECAAGDICAIDQAGACGDRRHPVGQGRSAADGGLGDARTAAARCHRGQVQVRRRQAVDRRSARLAAEDPTLRLELNTETDQLVLWCIGETHADVLLDRLKTKYGVAVETDRPASADARDLRRGDSARTARQTVRRPRPVRRVRHRHRAAPARRRLRVRRQGLRRRGPAAVHPVREKGLRAQMARGVAAGYPLVDLRVTLTDGKAHSVDSSDMAFQMAGALALKEAAKTAPSVARAGRAVDVWLATTTSER